MGTPLITESIAIIGTGCRFPGNIHDAESLWKLVIENSDGIVPFKDRRWPSDLFHDLDHQIEGTFRVCGALLLQSSSGRSPATTWQSTMTTLSGLSQVMLYSLRLRC